MWPNPQFTSDLATFTEKTLNGKLHFLGSGVGVLAQDGLLHNKFQTSFQYLFCLFNIAQFAGTILLKTANLKIT